MKKIALIALLLCLTSHLGFAQIVIQVPITEAEKQKVDSFTHDRDILKINDYVSPDLDSIGPVEHVIFRKAILLGGLKAVFEDYIVPNSARARQETRNGSVPGGGTAHWHYYYLESPGDFLESDVVIPQGAYEKGLYTTREKSQLLKISSLDQLKTLSAVTSNTWLVDWASLEKLPLKALHSGATRPAQFRMVQNARADFTLQDFAATPDMSIEEQGIRLYPIPGVKIGLSGSRHFLISKMHRDGAKIFEALQKGLKIMQKNGDIKHILSDSGFTNAKVKDWILLKAPAQ